MPGLYVRSRLLPRLMEQWAYSGSGISPTSSRMSSRELATDAPWDTVPLEMNMWRDEVGDAPLNKRGWTLQEMFLSNRIIHFADKRKCSGNVQPMLVRPPSQAFILQTCSGTGRRTRGMVCIPSSV
jgi:hypothetical protein